MKNIRKHFRFDKVTDLMLKDLYAGRMRDSEKVRKLIEADGIRFIGINIEQIFNIRRQLFGISNNITQIAYVIAETGSGKPNEIFVEMLERVGKLQDMNGTFLIYLNGRRDCSGHEIRKHFSFDASTVDIMKKNIAKLAETDKKISDSRYLRELIRRMYVNNIGVNSNAIKEINDKVTKCGHEVNRLAKLFNSGDFSYLEVRQIRDQTDVIKEIFSLYEPEAELLNFDALTNPIMSETFGNK